MGTGEFPVRCTCSVTNLCTNICSVKCAQFVLDTPDVDVTEMLPLRKNNLMLNPFHTGRRRQPDNEGISALTSSSNVDFSPGDIDWNDYKGYELVTSDLVSLGIVQRVFIDDTSGETSLYVVRQRDNRPALRVPTRVIGVITSKRLMLDVSEANLSKLQLEPIEYDAML